MVRKTERLNRYLSRCGLASRRQADEMIASGRISLNGAVVRRLGTVIDPENDRIEIDGRAIPGPKKLRYVLFHKPKGFLCSRHDPWGRATIYHLLPQELQDLRYVGRLDRDTQGLLLLTNDGRLIQEMTHPRYGLKRTYLAKVSGRLAMADLEPLRRGITFEGQNYQPASAQVLSSRPDNSLVRIEIAEGKKREVRMMFKAVGRRVLELTRIGFGPLSLGRLPQGQWRYLAPEEIARLKKKSPE